MSDKQIELIIKYYNSFATTKQKEIINKLLLKEKHTDLDFKKLNGYAFKTKMYLESNRMNVESRLDKLYRTSHKDKVKKQYFSRLNIPKR